MLVLFAWEDALHSLWTEGVVEEEEILVSMVLDVSRVLW